MPTHGVESPALAETSGPLSRADTSVTISRAKIDQLADYLVRIREALTNISMHVVAEQHGCGSE